MGNFLQFSTFLEKFLLLS